MQSAGETACLLIGGACVVDDEILRAADRIRQATGCRLAMPTFTGRFRRGGGLPTPPKVPYFPEDAEKFFAGVQQMILVESQAPCAFFACKQQLSCRLSRSLNKKLLRRPRRRVVVRAGGLRRDHAGRLRG